MKFFVKDFCETVQARVFIFDMQVDNDVLYHGIANQPSPAFSSLYLSDFLSFHTLNDKIFVKDFFETVQARVFIFGMQIDNDVLYCGIANQPTPLILPCIYLFFFSLHFSSKISPQLCRIETSNLVYRFTMTSCIMELKMDLLLFVLPYISSVFFLSRFFAKDIFTTVEDRNFKFGIQVHNDKLYGGIENGPSPICSSLYLFFFLFLQIFRQRYLYNCLR